jgi:glycerol dehydrogenase-like iron-containing ADH family enzyme
MNIWPLPRISFRQLSTVRESRTTALITDSASWSAIKGLIELPIAIQAEPAKSDKAFLLDLGHKLPTAIEVIYGIGDDKVIDIAKVIAHTAKRPLVVIPTSFASEMSLTATAEVKVGDGVETLTIGAPEEVIINWGLITDATPYHRGAGITEILSIAIALKDWQHAQSKNMTTPETRLNAWAMGVAAALSGQAMKSAAQIGDGSAESLRVLFDIMCTSVQLDNTLGHRRASRGVEHYFADIVKAEPHVIYAEKLAAGILFGAALHKLDTTLFRTAMDQAKVRYNQLSASDIRQAAQRLPGYAKERNLPYTILNDSDSAAIQSALERSALLTV